VGRGRSGLSGINNAWALRRPRDNQNNLGKSEAHHLHERLLRLTQAGSGPTLLLEAKHQSLSNEAIAHSWHSGLNSCVNKRQETAGHLSARTHLKLKSRLRNRLILTVRRRRAGR